MDMGFSSGEVGCAGGVVFPAFAGGACCPAPG